MEEIKFLSNRNNVIQISALLEKIAKSIRNEKLEHINVSSIKEIDFLKEMCSDANTQLGLLAVQTFVRLVDDGTLDAAFVLSMFVSMLPSASESQCTSIGEGIISLLLLDLKRRSHHQKGCPGSEYVCPFGMKPPQHPLIMLFQKKEVNVHDLVNKINAICGHHDKEIRTNSIEFLRPVFLYILCSPTIYPDSKTLWTCLLSHSQSNPKIQPLLMEVLGWCNISSSKSCLYATILIMECISVFSSIPDKTTFNMELCVYLASLLKDLLQYGYDPRPSLRVIFNVIHRDLQRALPYLNVLLVILCPVLQAISPVYLTELFRLLRLIVVTAEAGNAITQHMILDGLIVWIAHPACITEDCLGDVNATMKYIKHKSHPQSNGNGGGQSIESLTVNYFHPDIALGLVLAHLSEWLCSDLQSGCRIDEFLSTIAHSTAQAHFRQRINLFLRGIFLMNHPPAASASDILIGVVATDQTVAVQFVRPWLFKLLNDRSPAARHKLLKGLTKFAVVKENIPIILHTLQSISSGPLKPLALDMYLRLWQTEERTYPYLQNHLSLNADPTTSDWELNVAKAYTIKAICEIKAAKHGTDLVIHLSNILNACAKEDGETATAIALDAIICLCSSHTVNIASTWSALRPKFEGESRPKPLLSLCEFFGKVPTLYSPTVEYENLLAESIAKLWHFVVQPNAADQTIAAALRALQNFDHNSLRLSDLPAEYRQNIALPSEYLKNLCDGEAPPDPVDVLTYVPGECWLQLLTHTKPACAAAACDLVRHHIASEVAAFKSSVYTLPDGHPEPRHVNRLSRHSPLRAVLKYLLAESQLVHEMRDAHLVQLALRCISADFAKPLPSLHWFFMLEFMPTEPRLCLRVLANQMHHSDSARQMIENYIIASLDKRDAEADLLHFVELFPMVAGGLVHDLLVKWSEHWADYAFEQSKIIEFSAGCWFERLLEGINELLARSSFNKTDHASNYNVILAVLKRCYGRINLNDRIWSTFQLTCRHLSPADVDHITVPNGWSNINSSQTVQAFTLRCHLAQNSVAAKSLVWLNPIAKQLIESDDAVFSATLRLASTVLRSYDNEREVCLWTMDVLSKIQSILSNEPASALDPQFLRRFEVFCTTVLVRSGNVNLMRCDVGSNSTAEHQFDHFAESLLDLTALEAWRDCEARIYEFFYNVYVNSELDDRHLGIARNVLITFKSRPYFVHKTMWMRFVGVRRKCTV